MKTLAVFAVAADVLAATAFSVDQNLAAIVGVLVATVAVVMVVIGYIDKRIEHKLGNLQTLMLLRHDLVLGELKHLKDLLGVRTHAHSRKSDTEE